MTVLTAVDQVPRLMLAEAGAAYSHLAMIGNEHAAAAAEWRKRCFTALEPFPIQLTELCVS